MSKDQRNAGACKVDEIAVAGEEIAMQQTVKIECVLMIYINNGILLGESSNCADLRICNGYGGKV